MPRRHATSTWRTRWVDIAILLLLVLAVSFLEMTSVRAMPGDCTSFSAPLGTVDTLSCGINPLDDTDCLLDLLPGYSVVAGSLLVHCSSGLLTQLPTTIENSCALPVPPPTGVAAGTCPGGAPGATTAQLASRQGCTYVQQYGYTLVSGSLQLNCTMGALSAPVPSLSGSLCYHPTIVWFPLFAINPLASDTIYRTFDLVLSVSQTPAPCSPVLPTDAVFSFAWTVTSVAPSVVVFASYQREFFMPKNTLQLGVSYIVQVVTTVTSASNSSPARRRLFGASDADAPLDATSGASRRLLATTGTMASSFTLTVGRSPLQSLIAGGDRSRHVDTAIVFDGSQSYDPDGVSAMQYQWTCAKLTGGGGTCPLPASSLSSPNLQFAPNAFPSGQRYALQLRVSTSDGRSTTAMVHLTTLVAYSAASPIPLVTILDAPQRVNAFEYLRLEATVMTESQVDQDAMTYAWSTDCPNINLNSTASLDSPLGSSRILVLKPFVRDTALSTCTFTVAVTDSTAAASLAAPSTAAATIAFNTPPSSGSCALTSPAPGFTGEEFTTGFEVTCSGWSALPAAHGPLAYRVYYLESATVAAFYAAPIGTTPAPMVFRALTRTSSSSKLNDLVVPEGAWRLQVWVTDAFGAETRVLLTQPVVVTAMAASSGLTRSCYLASLAQTLLPSLRTVAMDAQKELVLIASLASRYAALGTVSSTDCPRALPLDAVLSHLESLPLVASAEAADVGVQLATTLEALVGNAEMVQTDGASERIQGLIRTTLGLLKSSIVTDRTPILINSLSSVLASTLTSCTRLPATLSLVHSLLSIQASAALPGQSLQAVSAAGVFQAQAVVQSERKGVDVAAGSLALQGDFGGFGIQVLPSSTLSASLTTTTGDALALDSATAVVTQQKNWRLDLIRLEGAWAECDAAAVAAASGDPSASSTATLASGLLQANLTYTDDSTATPTNGVIYSMPLSQAAIAATTLLACPSPADYKQRGAFLPSVACARVSPSSPGGMSTVGCAMVSYDPSTATMRCRCDRLGTFGLVYSDAPYADQFDSVCWKYPTADGQMWHIAYSVAYLLCFLVACAQATRILLAGWKVSAQSFLLGTYAVLGVFCLLRLYETIMYLLSTPKVTSATGTSLHSLAYLCLPWLLTFCVLHWSEHAQMAHDIALYGPQAAANLHAVGPLNGPGSPKTYGPAIAAQNAAIWMERKTKLNPFQRFAIPIVVLDAVLTVVFLVVLSYAGASSNQKDLSTVREALVWLVFSSVLLLSGLFLAFAVVFSRRCLSHANSDRYSVVKFADLADPHTVTTISTMDPTTVESHAAGGVSGGGGGGGGGSVVELHHRELSGREAADELETQEIVDAAMGIVQPHPQEIPVLAFNAVASDDAPAVGPAGTPLPDHLASPSGLFRTAASPFSPLTAAPHTYDVTTPLSGPVIVRREEAKRQRMDFALSQRRREAQAKAEQEKVSPEDRAYDVLPTPPHGATDIVAWMAVWLFLLTLLASLVRVLSYSLMKSDFESHPSEFIAAYHLVDVLSIPCGLFVLFFPTRSVLGRMSALRHRADQIRRAADQERREAEDIARKAAEEEAKKVAEEEARLAAVEAAKVAEQQEQAKKLAEEQAAKLAEENEKQLARAREQRAAAEKAESDRQLAKALQAAAIAQAIQLEKMAKEGLLPPAMVGGSPNRKRTSSITTDEPPHLPRRQSTIRLSLTNAIKPVDIAAADAAAANEPDAEDAQTQNANELDILTEGERPSEKQLRALQRATAMYMAQAATTAAEDHTSEGEEDPNEDDGEYPGHALPGAPRLPSFPPSAAAHAPVTRTWTVATSTTLELTPAAGSSAAGVPPSLARSVSLTPSISGAGGSDDAGSRLLKAKLAMLQATNKSANAARARE